jgi:hypothetical protein
MVGAARSRTIHGEAGADGTEELAVQSARQAYPEAPLVRAR